LHNDTSPRNRRRGVPAFIWDVIDVAILNLLHSEVAVQEVIWLLVSSYAGKAINGYSVNIDVREQATTDFRYCPFK
jgi:hypothetical protein